MMRRGNDGGEMICFDFNHFLLTTQLSVGDGALLVQRHIRLGGYDPGALLQVAEQLALDAGLQVGLEGEVVDEDDGGLLGDQPLEFVIEEIAVAELKGAHRTPEPAHPPETKSIFLGDFGFFFFCNFRIFLGEICQLKNEKSTS